MDFLSTEDPADLTTCDREPIHVPGAIQPHGVLLAVDAADWTIHHASANTIEHVGVTASTLMGEPLSRAIGSEPVERLRSAIHRPGATGLDPLTLHGPNGQPYEATWHRVGDGVLLELEPTSSTEPVSVSTLFGDVRDAIQSLQTAEGVQGVCDAAAVQVKRLTGYDRVMVYRLHPDDHGEVVAEEHEPGQDSFLGLHYPSSDIPRQARRLYELNHLRVIGDVDYEPVPLVGASAADGPPLDLSLAALRSVSPIHLAYLRNMGVGATLTISLMRGTRLWGLVACHHATPRRIDAQMRAVCRLLGQTYSLQVHAQQNEERHSYRTQLAEVEAQLVSRMSGAPRPAAALSQMTTPSPLEVTCADGMFARIDGESVTVGATPPRAAVEALLARMSTAQGAVAVVSDELGHRFTELAPFAEHAAGVLALPLSTDLSDVVMWFRGEVVRTVNWAGDPNKAVGAPATPATPLDPPDFAAISPRTSFDAWKQEVSGRCRPWLDAEIEAARGFAAAVPDILLSRARDRLAHLALHDGLTGLPNRGLLADRVAQALGRERRRSQRVAMLFVDLDRFKLVNDSMGHMVGDMLLCQAAQRLASATRATDTVARFGGDEFAVLCDGVTDHEAEHLAERIVQAFQVPFIVNEREMVVTASVGLALADSDATPSELLHDADMAMYRAKEGGRNVAAPFTPEMRAVSLRRVEIETQLRPALEDGQLHLQFQPLFTADGALTRFEALARWQVPGRGMVTPGEFIPVAESSGLMGPLTTWALDVGLRELAGWRGRRPDLDLTLSVNVSPTQMTPALHGVIDQVLRHHSLPPASLCLEITEGALVGDDAPTRQFLWDLREQGVRLSIDNFGTGFSSLAYLAKLPVHEVKVDRALIAELPHSRSHATIVASVVELAHQLGFHAVAEGVENGEQLATVRQFGVDLVQGYLLGRPVPAAQIERLLGSAQSPAPASALLAD